MAGETIAQTIFTRADQHFFAAASGDTNPLHMDSVAARRTSAGQPVVHGMHAFLWALEQLCFAGLLPADVTSINAQFKKFIYVDRPLQLTLLRRDPTHVKVELLADGVSATTLTFRAGKNVDAGEPISVRELSPVDLPPLPEAPLFESMTDLSGWLDHSDQLTALDRFPHSIGRFGFERVAALARLSSVVGMICPGLFSILSGFSLNFIENDTSRRGVGFKVSRTDDRFRLVALSIDGSGMRGEVSAFHRPQPVSTPTMQTVSSLVKAGEFTEANALIVGGSRGLGAATARLLTAGGGKVVLTYARGYEEALELQQDILGFCGSGSCAIGALDINTEIAAQLTDLPDINQLYYFPTPQIFHQRRDVFTCEIFDEFVKFYVLGFHDIVRHVVARQSPVALSVFYPSSVAIDERPKGMTEYVMAKAAGELLCADFVRHIPGLRICVHRIPRVLTDQTATIIPVDSADACEVMLPLLRNMTRDHQKGAVIDPLD